MTGAPRHREALRLESPCPDRPWGRARWSLRVMTVACAGRPGLTVTTRQGPGPGLPRELQAAQPASRPTPRAALLGGRARYLVEVLLLLPRHAVLLLQAFQPQRGALVLRVLQLPLGPAAVCMMERMHRAPSGSPAARAASPHLPVSLGGCPTVPTWHCATGTLTGLRSDPVGLCLLLAQGRSWLSVTTAATAFTENQPQRAFTGPGRQLMPQL